jgi:hypothetical protein
MKNINATQLAFIMSIKKADAKKKILHAIDKKGVKRQNDEKEKDPSVRVDQLSTAIGIDLDFYIKSIGKDFLKNQATGTYILNYPTSKLKPSKKTGLLPKSVAIPSTLRGFLNKEVIEEIKVKWNQKYAHEVKVHGIIFK